MILVLILVLPVIQGGRIERTLWSLLALLAERNSNNRRLDHVRYIWKKQMRMLSIDGGIALKPLHLRVTYANVLQVRIQNDPMLYSHFSHYILTLPNIY